MNTFIHYLKTRALRQIVQWLFVAVISIMVIGAFAVADAYAQGSYLCSDLTGASGGTCGIDAGCMDFNTTPPSSSFAAQVCGPTIAVVGGVAQDLELHGWAWDTNLGYVSLYCDTAGKNNGVACGSIPYGVKVDVTTGKMSGWAWSDNMGWISFGCQGGLNQGYACGSVNYNTLINLSIGKDLGKITGYAWADTVGWFNFQTGNASAKLLSLMMRTSTSATDWGVWTKAEVEDDTLTDEQKNVQPLKSTMPVAGTGEGYDIFVNVADIAGNPIEGGGGLDLDIVTTWEDTVGYNQISGEATDHSTENGYAVRKPSVQTNLGYELTFKSKDTTEGISYAHHGVTTSSMPTDGGNCYDGDGDGSCYTGEDNFFYKDFREGSAPANTVTYLGADVTLTIGATGESWTTHVSPISYPGGWRMEFLPQIDIPVFDYLAVPGDPSSAISSIQAIRNKADEFVLDGQENVSGATYTVTLTLDSGTEDVDYVFIDNLESNPEDGDSILGVTNVNDLDGTLLAFPFAPDEALQESLPGASIKSVVTPTFGFIPAMPPRYYSNGLPRGENSEVQSQAAEILSGSVFSPGATEAVQNSDVPLFGDIAVYELRTSILEDVSGLIRGANFDDVIGSSTTLNDGTTPDSLYKNSFKNNRLYYFEDQDLTVESLHPLIAAAGGDPITLVVKGGDIYIRNNLDYPNQEIGLIAFESDDAVDGAFTTKGGRIYVHSSVTDMVNVHIFADGPVFRYTNNVCYYWGNYGPGNSLTGLREPNFVEAGRCSDAGTFEEPVTALANQFYLKGNIASFNCLGCSKNIQPSRGDGLIIGGPSALNYAIARLYDFNYFSYYREDPLNPGSYSGVAANNLDATQTKAVYFEYSPAPTDLLGFRNF